MNSNKSHLFPFIIIGIFLIMLATSCKSVEKLPSITLIEGMFTDIYEDQNGLHLILPNKSEILVELEDEQDKYYFALNEVEHEIRYFRIDNGKECTGVFVVLNDELYRINSHFNRIK